MECAALLSDDEERYEQPIEELNRILVQMLAPPPMHPSHPANAIRALERSFENCYAELETHLHLQDPSSLSLYSFLSRLEYLEDMLAKRAQSVYTLLALPQR